MALPKPGLQICVLPWPLDNIEVSMASGELGNINKTDGKKGTKKMGIADQLMKMRPVVS